MLQVLCAALLWGFNGALAGRLMGDRVVPEILVPLRFLGSFLVLLPLMVRYPPRWQEKQRLLGVGLILAITQVTFFWAISVSSVATALFLQYLAPVLLTLFALLRGERVSRFQLAGVAIAIFGAYFLVVGPQGLVGGWLGLALGLGSAVAFSTFSYLGMTVTTTPITVLGISMGIGTLLSLPFFSWDRLEHLLPWDFAGIAYVVLMGTVVPFSLFLWGVQKIPARLATLIAMVEPCCGAVWAVFMANQPLQPLALVGGCCILAGVGLGTLKPAHPPAPH